MSKINYTEVKIMTKYCKNCGCLLEDETKVCPDCGHNENKPKGRSKFPIILIIIAVICIIGIGAYFYTTPVTQEVNVYNHTFEIPGFFNLDEDLVEENQTYSYMEWNSPFEDSIGIYVCEADESLEYYVEDTSKKGTLYGHEGYFEEDEFWYYFSFMPDSDHVCVIAVNSEDLFEEISVN